MRQLQHYGWVIRHWLWLILLGTFLCAGITFGINKYIVKNVYQVTSLIQVNGPVTANTGSTSNSTDVYSDQALAVADSLLVTTTNVLQAVTQQVPDVTLSQLQQTVSASPRAGTQIIAVQVQANNPQLAAEIANAVVTIFIQQQTDKILPWLKNQDTQIAQELVTLGTTLKQAQGELTNLQKTGTSDQITRQTQIIATDQANYNALLVSQQQLHMQENQVENALIVAQPASPPDQPTSPHATLNTTIAAALALLLTLALALLFDWLDTSIQTPKDVVYLARLQSLGSVPLSQHALLLPKLVDPSALGDTAVERAFLLMGSNADILDKSPCTLQVTGLRRRVGSTTIATNLAIALAQSGKRVLLVDANLQKPALQRIFHQTSDKGFVESVTSNIYHFQRIDVRSWLQPLSTNVPNLWLLPAGTIPAYFSMVQHLSGVRALKEWLFQGTSSTVGGLQPNVVDIILFDTPALTEGIDALALASVTDGYILVGEAGKEYSELLNKAEETLAQRGPSLIGVVLNRQTPRHRSYFYAQPQAQKLAPLDRGQSYLEDTTLGFALPKKQPLAGETLPAHVQHSIQDSQAAMQIQTLKSGDAYSVRRAFIPTTPE